MSADSITCSFKLKLSSILERVISSLADFNRLDNSCHKTYQMCFHDKNLCAKQCLREAHSTLLRRIRLYKLQIAIERKTVSHVTT